jgi:hypothetical protein
MATCQPHEDVMILKFPAVNKPAVLLVAVLLAAVAVVAIGLDPTQANAQTQPDVKKPKFDKDGRPYYGPKGPNVSYQQGPHTRIYVSRRSWLDGGTEVLPGDRKFTDYAFPPEVGYPSFARENNNRPIDRQPLSPASDLGGFPQRITPY